MLSALADISNEKVLATIAWLYSSLRNGNSCDYSSTLIPVKTDPVFAKSSILFS